MLDFLMRVLNMMSQTKTNIITEAIKDKVTYINVFATSLENLKPLNDVCVCEECNILKVDSLIHRCRAVLCHL